MYEISNYAPPGHEARHNLTYWRGETYLGIGAGAHSLRGRRRRAAGDGGTSGCPRATSSARASSRHGGGGRRDGRSTRARGEFVFLNLRLREGFELADFEARFGVELRRIFGARAARLFEGGLLIRAEGRICLSERGLELADSVFAEFI